MKETAVEWLFEQLCSEKLSWNKDSNGTIFFDKITSDILQEAKEMEREQMIYIIKTYHNNLFYLPLSENGEADRILDLILTKQIKPKP
jgi:hypothetical protein